VIVLGGVAIGVPAALMGAGVLRSLMFGLSTTDPMTLPVAVVIVVVAAAASLVPAVRASRVDPGGIVESGVGRRREASHDG
jgi:hypothetical protein